MYKKIDFVKRIELSTGTTLIKFEENVELTAVCIEKYGYHTFKIENPKLDFEITKIFYKSYSDDNEYDITNRYDKSTKTFKPYLSSDSHEYTFYISAIIQLKPDPSYSAVYQYCISSDEFENLKLHNFIKSEIVLPDHDNSKFIYYVKKVASSKIELFIENPYDVEIQGNKGNFRAEYETKKHIEISFGFGQSYLIMKQIKLLQNESFHNSVIDESRPQSRFGSPIPFELPNEPKLSNDIFPDAFLIASDKTKIPCHRCTLAKFSNIFVELFYSISILPVTINVEEFNAETIKASIDFLYGKNDSIKGKEMEIFKFAVKYNIKMLMDACYLYFEESVNPTNVCEFIQIAYSNNFEELKQKCLKILVEKKKEIDPPKFHDLPKNILIDAFCL